MSKHTVKCPDCGSDGYRVDEVDAYACKDCNKWLEEPCTDPDCIFCHNRTSKPFLTLM